MNTSPASSTPRVHLAFLDGIRALAALYVVVYHCLSRVRPSMGGLHGPFLLLGAPFRYGHWAVDVFIVLSGFCLMLPVARSGSLRGGAWLFFKKRARRILPTYYFAVALTAVLWTLTALHERAPGIPFPTLPAKTWAIFLFLLQEMFDPGDVNSALWSVAVEWKIYFLLPLLVLAWQRFGAWRMAAVALTVSCLLFPLVRHTFLYGLHVHYIALFTFGMVAASLSNAPPILQTCVRIFWVYALPVFLCALAAFVLEYKHSHAGLPAPWLFVIDTLVGAGTACGLLGLTRTQGTFLHALLNWRPLVWIGTFAYSVYLIHMPIIKLIYLYVLQPLHRTEMVTFVLLATAGTAVIIGISYLFFLFCERPFLNTRRNETPAETARDAALSPAP